MKVIGKNAIALFIVGIVLLIIIPLHPVVLDTLFIFNIALSMIILMITMYTKESLEFSVFPSLLLVTTLFRVGLSVSSTRAILGNQGDAGQVIKTFGDFVIQGNPTVGFIVFLIIIIVQFVVITKGAERVAEVAARFTLDAMPGKQMAIDADLNSGLIDDVTARERRQKIHRESNFYGAMDGASKFVKGDAIVSIIIVVINIIGGTIIGMVQGGMGLNEVLKIYTVATVGDGLVSQLPALLVSTATAMIVTRAASDSNINEDITTQMKGQPIILAIAGVIVIILSLIPGMPKVQPILMGLLLLFVASKLNKSIRIPAIEEAEPVITEVEFYKNPENVYSILTIDPIEVEFGYSLVPLLDSSKGGNFIDRVVMFRRQFAVDMGMVIPSVRIKDNVLLNPNEYVIKIKGENVSQASVLVDRYLAFSPGETEEEIGGIDTVEPAFGIPAKWITREDKEMAEIYGYTVIDPLSVIITHLSQVIRNHAHELLSRQDVSTLLDSVKKLNPTLVDEVVPSIITLSELQKVLCNLLKEQIPIRDMPTILETVGDYGASVKDADLLTEYVRQALKRTITRKYADKGMLKVITLDPELENTIMNSVKKSEHGTYLTVDPDTMHRIVTSLSQELTRTKDMVSEPIILSSPVVRVYFRKLIDQFLPDTTVLSFNEIENSVKIQAVGVIRAG